MFGNSSIAEFPVASFILEESITPSFTPVASIIGTPIEYLLASPTYQSIPASYLLNPFLYRSLAVENIGTVPSSNYNILLDYQVGGLSTNKRLLIENLLSIIKGGTSVTKSAGTATNDTSVGSIGWTLVSTDLFTKDTDYAIAFAPSGGITNYLKATNFSFNIPTNTVIKGIKVHINRETNGSGIDTEVKIIKGGVIGTTNRSTGQAWPDDDDGYEVFGGDLDLWGETWTAADINASNFGVVFSAQIFDVGDDRLFVDHVTITVYYGEGSPVSYTAQIPSLGTNRIDYLSSSQTNINKPIEYTGNIHILNNLPIQLLGNIIKDNNYPVEYLSLIDSISNINITHILNLSTNNNINIEGLLQIIGNGSTPVEYSGQQILTIVSNGNLPMEFVGLLQTNKNLDVEYTGGKITNLIIPADYLGGLDRTTTLSVDFLKLMDSNGKLPIDGLLGLQLQKTLHLDSLGTSDGNGVLNIEYLGRIGISKTTALEYLRDTQGNNSVLIESLSQLSGNPVIPIEYLGVEAIITDGKVCRWILENRGVLWVLSPKSTTWVPLSTSNRLWILPDRGTEWVQPERGTTWNLRCRCDC